MTLVNGSGISAVYSADGISERPRFTIERISKTAGGIIGLGAVLHA